ncbi:MAG: hypothetical protein KC477_13910 [Oceanospirillaceae bacterium]|nr:hypothetical protein [Oceanospirillaceae bacterium]
MKLPKYGSFFPILLSLLLSSQAQAVFHLWQINEVFSSADGSLQFIELFSPSAGQEFLANHTITATSSDGPVSVFTFPTNSNQPTNNKHLLLATRDFQVVTGIEPDFIIATGFLPVAGGSLNFAGVDTLNLTNLPLDGFQSLSGNGAVTMASPTNFAGHSSTVPSIEVFYDAASGSLDIDFVSVTELGSYSASMLLVANNPLAFDLVEATQLSDLIAQDLARLSLATGVLILPRVQVGNSIYSATLMLDATTEIFRFTLLSATHLGDCIECKLTTEFAD